MSTPLPKLKPPKIDVALGLVARAWQDACATTGRPVRPAPVIVPVKPQRPHGKSGIYRIEGAGDGGADVIAKRCTRSTGSVERSVYERVLPHVGVPGLRYYGYLDEADGEFCWLFIEDVGDTKLAATDRDLAAEWLARMHTGAASLDGEVSLPERGPEHYLAHLHVGRDLIRGLLGEALLPGHVRDAVHEVLRLGERMEARWHSIRAVCDAAPRTLVHGDFARQNVRIRTTPASRQLVALDWGTAGWGPPAADVPYWPTRRQRPRGNGALAKAPKWNGTVPLDVYVRHAGGRWDGLRAGDLTRLARVGTIFRALSGIRWAAEQMQGGGTSGGGERLCWSAAFLPDVLAQME